MAEVGGEEWGGAVTRGEGEIGRHEVAVARQGIVGSGFYTG